jgi:hypothetical protein
VEDSAPEVEVRTKDRSSPMEVGLIIATMPDPEARWYFGPCRSRPATIPGTRAPRRRATSASPLTVGTGTSAGGEDRFLAFNPETDIQVGHFVALSVEQEELYAGVSFYVEKVPEFRKGGRENKSDLVLALPWDRNADRVSIEHRTIRELHGSAVGAIM